MIRPGFGDIVAALADAVDAHRDTARAPGRARERAAHQIRRALATLSARRAAGRPDWTSTVDAVANRELDPLTAAERLIDR